MSGNAMFEIATKGDVRTHMQTIKLPLIGS